MWSIFWSIYKRMARKQDLGFSGYFSPDYIYNKRANKNESGMYARDIMKILHNHGTLPDISFQNSDMDDIMAANFKIKGYAQVETIEECKKALYMNGLCLISHFLCIIKIVLECGIQRKGMRNQDMQW